MTLTVDELEQVTKLLINYIRWCGTNEISFSGNADHYLKISYKDRNIIYDKKLYKCPPYVIGSLSEDIEGLKSKLAGEYLPSNIDLERLGAIFSVLGETLKLNEDKWVHGKE